MGGPLGASSHSGLWSAGSSDLDPTSLKFLRAIQNGDPEFKMATEKKQYNWELVPAYAEFKDLKLLGIISPSV
jgi:hypothetical protein